MLYRCMVQYACQFSRFRRAPRRICLIPLVLMLLWGASACVSPFPLFSVGRVASAQYVRLDLAEEGVIVLIMQNLAVFTKND